jgi:hypothetical protein
MDDKLKEIAVAAVKKIAELQGWGYAVLWENPIAIIACACDAWAGEIVKLREKRLDELWLHNEELRQQLEAAKKKHYTDYSEFCDVTADNQRLRQQVSLLKDLVDEVRREHRDDQCAGYNECDKSPCKWCADAMEAMK